MSKQDRIIVAVLFVALLAWGFLYRPRPKPPGAEPATPDAPVTEAPAVNAVPPATAEDAEIVRPKPTAPVTPPAATPVVPAASAVRPERPEQIVRLANDGAAVAVSSWGAAVKSIELASYRAAVERDSAPVVLDFGAQPALALAGLPGFATNHAFTVDAPAGDAEVRLSRTAGGLELKRALTLHADYRMTVTDVFVNVSDLPLALPAHEVGMGPMEMVKSRARVRGQVYLGFDTLAETGGAKVERWGKKQIPSLFGGGGGGCSRGAPAAAMPADVEYTIGMPLTWAATRNKFFVQILAPEDGGAGGRVQAWRDPEAEQLVVAKVAGAVQFAERVLQPGESFTRTMSYYAGPKKFSILRELGRRQDEVMLYAWWQWFRWLCRVLLWTLNALYGVIPNYGIAIILLTVLVRMLFWPVTHKSTQSMKKMQAVQPLVTELREKHKGNPQKMNQEVMALYKEHKVNPMAGCLPILVQMPVFIALFTVLRSAVELRFAPFLWIRDLSEPEMLFAGSIPVVGALNILPVVMTATMIWQQRLTPTGGDPQQQKMMMWFMPIFMLFLFYSMPSALVLYWSVSQLLSIAQLLIQRRFSGKGGGATTPAPATAKA